MSKKAKTQTELLQEIVDLLTPMNNLAVYQIGQINDQLNKQKQIQTALAAQAEKSKEDNG